MAERSIARRSDWWPGRRITEWLDAVCPDTRRDAAPHPDHTEVVIVVGGV
jgi:hypothetical protein